MARACEFDADRLLMAIVVEKILWMSSKNLGIDQLDDECLDVALWLRELNPSLPEPSILADALVLEILAARAAQQPAQRKPKPPRDPKTKGRQGRKLNAQDAA